MGPTTALAVAAVAAGIVMVARFGRLRLLRRLVGGLVLVTLTSLVFWGVQVLWPGSRGAEWSAAAVLLALGYVAARVLLLGVFDWLLARRFGFELPRLASDVISLIVYLVVSAAVLKSTLEIDVGPLLATSAVITVVMGLALQETLTTLLAGLTLTWERRLENGAWIQLDGVTGAVEELGWRSLVLRTRLGDRLVVPNSDLARARVRLLGRGREPVAVAVTLGVSYAAAPHAVKEVLRRVAETIPGVETSPEPQLLVREMGDSAVIYECRLWTLEPWCAADLTDAFLSRAWTALARHGMEIPFPQRTVHMVAPAEHRSSSRECGEALAGCELFRGLPKAALDGLSASAVLEVYAPGEDVVREGEASTALYVVARGRADVLRGGTRMAVVGAGEVFGEMAFLLGTPRAATVQALTELVVVRADERALRALVAERGEVAEELASRMAERQGALDAVADAPVTRQSRRTLSSTILRHLQRFVGG